VAQKTGLVNNMRVEYATPLRAMILYWRALETHEKILSRLPRKWGDLLRLTFMTKKFSRGLGGGRDFNGGSSRTMGEEEKSLSLSVRKEAA